jgi:hypothetical protein
VSERRGQPTLAGARAKEGRSMLIDTCGIQIQAAVLDVLIYGARSAQKRFLDVVSGLRGRFYINEA